MIMNENHIPTKSVLIKSNIDWLILKTDWTLFTCTVLFNPIRTVVINEDKKEKYESVYRLKVLQKIRRTLEKSNSNWFTSIPCEQIYYYEYDQCKSIHRVTSNKSVHHIHSIIPIRTSQLRRFWSIDNNCLKPRILKDILSIDEVNSILIEPMINGKEMDWLNYITKFKSL